MADNAAEIVQLRNAFYRDNYKSVLSALFLMVIINVASVGIIYYQLTHHPAPQYFAMSSDGKIVKLHPLSEPVLGLDVVLQWASRASVAAYTYNFVDYREALNRAQQYFTDRGWSNFELALRASRQLETVQAKHLMVSAVATGAPVALDRGVINGSYVWKIQMPMLVTYQSASERTTQPLIITMLVSRVSVVDYPQGIAIVSYVSAEGEVS